MAGLHRNAFAKYRAHLPVDSSPVFGFGLRAWFSAFELPRRAHLFEGKAAELTGALERVKADRLHPRKTLTHIELGEHFFESEHREWCRLILEAEWFV